MRIEGCRRLLTPANNMKFQLPWSWRTYLSFCCLAYLISAAHELAHHAIGYLTSGQFGRMSFNLFVTAENHPHPVLVSLAGPLITYAAAWCGSLLLIRGVRPVLGYGLIAGSSVYMRLVGVVGGGGDESVISRTLTGIVHRWALISIVAALALPPIYIAFRSLGNPSKAWIFAGSMFGPFIPLLFVRLADQRWFIANVNTPESFHQPLIAGIPVAVLLLDTLVLVIFLAFGLRKLRQECRVRAVPA
jgi:hypothetical protein